MHWWACTPSNMRYLLYVSCCKLQVSTKSIPFPISSHPISAPTAPPPCPCSLRRWTGEHGRRTCTPAASSSSVSASCSLPPRLSSATRGPRRASVFGTVPGCRSTAQLSAAARGGRLAASARATLAGCSPTAPRRASIGCRGRPRRPRRPRRRLSLAPRGPPRANARPTRPSCSCIAPRRALARREPRLARAAVRAARSRAMAARRRVVGGGDRRAALERAPQDPTWCTATPCTFH